MPIRFQINYSCLQAFKPFTHGDNKSPGLRGVRCEVSREGVVLVATDARKLLALRIELAKDVETEFGAFTIPAALLSHLPEPKGDSPLKTYPPLKPQEFLIGVTVEADGDQVSIVGEWTVSGTVLGDTYPDWRQFFPARQVAPMPQAAAPRLFGESLAAFCTAARSLNIAGAIEIYPGGEMDGAFVFFNIPNAIGMLMPMKKGDENTSRELPAWAREGAAGRRAGAKKGKGKKAPQPKARRTRGADASKPELPGFQAQ